MKSARKPGGVIHTYQRYDPMRFPGPNAVAGPDLASFAFEHMLTFGSLSELTDEELARAVRIDPSEIEGFLPNVRGLIEMLLERKRKILATYETDTVQEAAAERYIKYGARVNPPAKAAGFYARALATEQLADLERLWYRLDDRSRFARELLQVMERLAAKYQIDELAAKYRFTGATPMSIEKALDVEEELETIDCLLKQLEEAVKNGRIGVIDIDELEQFAEPGQMDEFRRLQRMTRLSCRRPRQSIWEHFHRLRQMTPMPQR